MFAAALALAAAVSWGIGDFLGGFKSRTLRPVAVLIVAQPVGAALLAIWVGARGQGPPGRGRDARLRLLLRPHARREPGRLPLGRVHLSAHLADRDRGSVAGAPTPAGGSSRFAGTRGDRRPRH